MNGAYLKGKFSSGIEGALASTLNCDFNWKQLSEMILWILLWMFSKFIWVTLIQKQQKYKEKRRLNFGRGRRTLLWFEIWNLDTSSEGLIFSRTPNMQVLCPYYVKKTHESNHCIDSCVVVSLNFELNESIIKQIID